MVRKKTEQTVEETAQSKDIMKTEQAQVPAEPTLNDAMMEGDAGAGFENVGANDLAIPFLVILQSGSPQLKRGEQKIEGATEGDIFNTVSNAVYNGSEGIFVVPCTYRKAWIEWTPREAGGGFAAQHDNEDILKQTTKDQNGRDVLANGNIIVTTAYQYVLVIDPVTGDYSRAVISFTSTQLKKSRKWNSIMSELKMTRKDGSKFTPPMFSHVYRLVTEPEQNELGQWSGWKIELYSRVPSIEIYDVAKKFAADISKGAARLATPPTAAADDNVPF